jgi:hypothetical protein
MSMLNFAEFPYDHSLFASWMTIFSNLELRHIHFFLPFNIIILALVLVVKH